MIDQSVVEEGIALALSRLGGNYKLDSVRSYFNSIKDHYLKLKTPEEIAKAICNEIEAEIYMYYYDD